MSAIDRQKTCPFLIRCFVKTGAHHSADSFAGPDSAPVDDETHIYAWPDSSLKEVSDIVRDLSEDARSRGAKLSFRMVYPDKSGQNAFVDLGIVSTTTRGHVDARSLSSLNFQSGDFLDIAVFLPQQQ